MAVVRLATTTCNSQRRSPRTFKAPNRSVARPPDASVTRRARAEFCESTPDEVFVGLCLSAAASRPVALAGVSIPETRDQHFGASPLVLRVFLEYRFDLNYIKSTGKTDSSRGFFLSHDINCRSCP